MDYDENSNIFNINLCFVVFISIYYNYYHNSNILPIFTLEKDIIKIALLFVFIKYFHQKT